MIVHSADKPSHMHFHTYRIGDHRYVMKIACCQRNRAQSFHTEIVFSIGIQIVESVTEIGDTTNSGIGACSL